MRIPRGLSAYMCHHVDVRIGRRFIANTRAYFEDQYVAV